MVKYRRWISAVRRRLCLRHWPLLAWFPCPRKSGADIAAFR